MLHLTPRNASSVATIIGIDPGSETLGIARIDFDVVTLDIVRTTSKTFVGSKLEGMNWWLAQTHSERFARIEAHKQNLKNILFDCSPIIVACESPFYNSLRPSAYGVLVEVLGALHQACFEYHPDLAFTLIDPPSAKKAVGAKGNAKKEQMREAVLVLHDLKFQGPVSLGLLDEHSIDAIAIAYSKLQEFRNLGY